MNCALGGKRCQRGHSRDLMPPPPIPIQRPYVFMGNIPTPNVNEVKHNSGGGSRSQPRIGIVAPHHQRNASDLTRMVVTSRGRIPPPACFTANNGGNPSPFGLRPPAPRIYTSRGPSLDHASPPSIIARCKSQSDADSLSKASSARSFGNIAHCHTQPYDDGSLQSPPTLDDRVIHPYTQSNRLTSRLGLSRNARGSGHQASQSLSSPNFHRRPLGQDTSASPHFLPRRSSTSTSMLSLRGQQSTSMSLAINPQSSTTNTPLGSRARDSLVRAPENFANPDRVRNFVTDPGTPTFRRPDASRGRLPTADAEASAQRRRANR